MGNEKSASFEITAKAVFDTSVDPLWIKDGVVQETQYYHEDENNNYFYTVKEVIFDDGKTDPLDLGTDIDRDAAMLYQGQRVKVIVVETA